MKVVEQFAVMHDLMVPVALAVGEQPPPNLREQKWLLQLSGVCIPDLQGNSADWRRETLSITPDFRSALRYTINIYGIHKPPGEEDNQYVLSFQVDKVAIFAAPSSILATGTPANAGFAVDLWRPSRLGTGTDSFSGQVIPRLFSGIDVEVAVRNAKSTLHRVSYQISLLGKIHFIVKTF
jgi:hypothetical protein